MSEPSWLTVARRYLGVHEVSGPHHNPQIIKLLDQADGALDGKTLQGIRDDETPWCASFVSGVLEEARITSARTAWARGYLKWGSSIPGPAVGAVVVFERGPTSGHVGFVVGRSGPYIMVLGGNQGDMVKVSPFPQSRVIGYRWPSNVGSPTIGFNALPIVNSDGKVSSNEA